MRTQTKLRQAILVGSFSILAVPVLLPNLSNAGTRASEQEMGRVSQLERDLAGGEFLTQADRDLVERVRVRLQEDLAWSAAAQTIGIYADAGTVFLNGYVSAKEEKRELGARVQRIKGVEAVKNRLRTRTNTVSNREGGEASDDIEATQTTDLAYDSNREGVEALDDIEATQTAGPTYDSQWERGQRLLEQHLPAGRTRDFYQQRIAALGYTITSAITNRPNYVEYETVKGDQTYEVRLTIDPDTARARFVNVAPNTWQTAATQRRLAWNDRLQDRTQTPAGMTEATPQRQGRESRAPHPMRGSRYSDRDRAQTKSLVGELEALPLRRDKEFYLQALRVRDYKVIETETDTEERLILEAAKNGQAVILNVQFDADTGRSTELTAATPWWDPAAAYFGEEGDVVRVHRFAHIERHPGSEQLDEE